MTSATSRLFGWAGDPPLSPVVSKISGLTEYAAVNRAVGVLIDQGNHPDRAHAELRRAAAHDGLTPPDYAARLLEANHRAAVATEPAGCGRSTNGRHATDGL